MGEANANAWEFLVLPPASRSWQRSRLSQPRNKKIVATTHTYPRGLRLVPAAKIGPISAKTRTPGASRAPSGVTVDRRSGVVQPTARAGQAALPAVVAEATAIALQDLELLEARVREVARDFRSSDVGAAQRGLSQLVQGTRTIVRLAALSAHAAGTNVREFCRATGSTADRQLQRVLDQLTAVLIAKDRNAIANLLDGEFVTSLSAWRSIVESLGERSFDPGPDAA
jgi:hypothetical protein